MNKNKQNSNLRFPHSQLIILSERLLIFLERDANIFEQYGIKEQHKFAFKQKLDDFTKIPENKELVLGQRLITKRKKEIISKLKEQLRQIQLRAQLAFGKFSEKYNDLRVKTISTLTEQGLIDATQKYLHFAENNAELLMEFGFTKENYLMVKDLLNKMEEAVFDLKKLQSRQKKMSEKRKSAAEEIYQTIVSYSEIGKMHWLKYNNEIRYRDYVLYLNKKTEKK